MVMTGYRRIAGLLSRAPDAALLAARIILGGLMLMHGVMKFQAPGGLASFQHLLTTLPNVPFPGFTGTVLPWVEVLGGAMLILGALARLAALVLAVEMVIIAVLVKFADLHLGIVAPARMGVGAEIEFLFIAGLVVVLLLGPGRFSVDAVARLEPAAPAVLPRQRVSQPTHLPG